MPELPEVETTCQGIRSAVINQTIREIVIRESRLRWPVSRALLKLRKIQITNVSRRAKYILMQSTLGSFIIHLGMSGRLCCLDEKIPYQKHDHIDFVFDNGTLLRYTDPRRFGAVLWTTKDPLKHRYLAKLGVEPLLPVFNAHYLHRVTQNKQQPIKQLIMDQKVVVGVGNIYANEALYQAKISPLRYSHSLSLNDCAELVRAIRKILTAAIKQGGTTLRDFLSAKGKPGYFKQKLLVYGRQGMACLHCGQSLDVIRIQQRTTVYCSTCQI